MKNGYGVLKYPDGDTYEGEFKYSKFNGHGVYKNANGCIYEGNFENGK
jgi:hypothetical protein